MLCWPGGDAYFGALLNSWIHVMMYSYYLLSLLRVNCPWKRILTQAQLLQFTTVMIYSCCTVYIHYKQNDAEFQHFAAIGIQCFEMTSLFLLFMHFYSKTYKKMASRKKPNSETENGSDSVPEQVSISSESSDDAKKYS
jgi:elongation of very long chain fatty acids protein 4